MDDVLEHQWNIHPAGGVPDSYSQVAPTRERGEDFQQLPVVSALMTLILIPTFLNLFFKFNFFLSSKRLPVLVCSSSDQPSVGRQKGEFQKTPPSRKMGHKERRQGGFYTAGQILPPGTVWKLFPGLLHT